MIRVAQRIARRIDRLGHPKVIIKTDQEPAIKDLSAEARKIRLDQVGMLKGSKEACWVDSRRKSDSRTFASGGITGQWCCRVDDKANKGPIEDMEIVPGK